MGLSVNDSSLPVRRLIIMTGENYTITDTKYQDGLHKQIKSNNSSHTYDQISNV